VYRGADRRVTFSIDRTLGSEWFVDYSNGASPRLAFDAHWRYQMSNAGAPRSESVHVTGYSSKHDAAGVPATPRHSRIELPTDGDKSDYLTLFCVSLQLQYYGGTALAITWARGRHLSVWVENRRKVLKDPVSLKLHRGLYPEPRGDRTGALLQGHPAVSLEFALAGHLALSQRPEQFVSGINSNVMAVEFRFGGNYYFTPGPRKAPAAAPRALIRRARNAPPNRSKEVYVNDPISGTLDPSAPAARPVSSPRVDWSSKIGPEGLTFDDVL